ncbi:MULTISPECIES: hypothetical protein [unclassified Streptomyces]|uniref:hypothetical protein n=1 Tax=unclassified Streptomyces TaxID=2593676 RepID=UPI001660CE62|nr:MULTISPECIES: hypothetical protein [unclassified Streptomyces]
MATDPTDFCPNEKCGGTRNACGCPSDLNTQSLMVCVTCGNQWLRPYGSTSTRCRRPGCGQDASLVTVPAARPPEYGEDGKPLTTVDGPDDECHAEFIDGSWTNCGCPDCEQAEEDEMEMYG